MIAPARRILRLVPIAVLLAAAGCDFFRPDQPEIPTEPSFTPNYSDPDSTLETIARAIRDKARTIGLTAYGEAFAESTSTSTPGYHHFFWPNDVTPEDPPPADWNRQRELLFYVYLVNLRPDEYRLTWEKDDLNPDIPRGQDGWEIHRHYLLIAETPDGIFTSTLAVGFADLTMIRTSGDWRIVKWEDRADPNANPSDPEQVTLGKRRLASQ